MPSIADPPAIIEPTRFRAVLGRYPTGVCVVTAAAGEGEREPVAMVVGSFASVSLDPPLVGFFPARTSRSWPRIERAGAFCINVLGADHLDLCRQITRSPTGKLVGAPYRVAPHGAPILKEAVAWIDCTLESVFPAGDHDCVIGRVQALGDGEAEMPLLFHRGRYGTFREL